MSLPLKNNPAIIFVFVGDIIPHANIIIKKNIIPHIGVAFANLEAPLTDSIKKNVKTGNTFKSFRSTAPILNKIGINTVTLANNHIMDYGKEGLNDTISFLSENNFKYVGAGENLIEARRPLIFEESDLKLAFINACEKEFSSASSDKPGANPFDLIDLCNQITELKNEVDKVFLIYHGGLEYYPLPTPTQRKTLRFLIDIGLDGVICHHTHVFGAYEYYKDKPIFYSLGNFYTPTKRQMPNEYYESAILTLNIEKDNISHELYPIIFDNMGIYEMNDKDAMYFNDRLKSLNQILMDDQEFEKQWNELIEERKYYYSNIISRFNNRYIKKLRKLNLFPNPSYNSKRVLQLLNVIRCDAHRETMIDILEKEYRSKYEK